MMVYKKTVTRVLILSFWYRCCCLVDKNGWETSSTQGYEWNDMSSTSIQYATCI